MKWLVWLLLLGNAALLGYFRLVYQPHGEPVVAHAAIDPDRLKILTAQQLAQLPKKEEPPVLPMPSESASVLPPVLQCYEWGIFASPDAARAKAQLDRLGLAASARERTPQDAIRYWVYVPPRKSMEEAQTKVDEIRALGVEEVFIVQDPKWQFAISLGVFKEEALASKYLQDLQSRGVRSAVKGRRNHEGGQTSYVVREVSPVQADELGRLRPDFPGSELKQVNCQ